ncbi:MAG: amidohydrolase [Nitriliruptoraceae bacterium]
MAETATNPHTIVAEAETRGRGPRGTLITADRVVTLGHARTTATAVIVRGSRVVWVGDDVEQAPPHQDRIDLDGCVLGPAFVDAHVHMTPTGLMRTGLDLADVASGAEVLHAVRSYAAHHTGRVIWGHGLDPHGFEDELPTPDELAHVAAGKAIFLSRVDGHACFVDRRTLASAPLARAEGVERNPSGVPTGMLRREANHIMRRWSVGAMAEAELADARRAAVGHAASLGIGSVHEMGGPDMMGLADFDAWVVGDWPIEVVPYWGELAIDIPLSRDLRHAGGDVFLDGSFGAHTAALSEPYEDAAHTCGNLEFDDETVTNFYLEAAAAGLQAGVHAIGDSALRQVVRCLRSADETIRRRGAPDTIRRTRHRIEHAELLPPDLFDDLAELGVVISAQPAFEARWGGPNGMYATRLGTQRASWTNPHRALADRGIGIAFGSDANVTPLDPWGTIHAAENRHFHQHAVSRMEAVSMSTLGGRHAAKQERYVGVVRAGMRADLAAFEGDPYAAADPRNARCVLTIVHGRVAYGNAPLPDGDGRCS